MIPILAVISLDSISFFGVEYTLQIQRRTIMRTSFLRVAENEMKIW